MLGSGEAGRLGGWEVRRLGGGEAGRRGSWEVRRLGGGEAECTRRYGLCGLQAS